MPQSQPGRTAQAAPPAAEQDSRSHSPPTPALALSNLGLLLCRGMNNITLSARFVGVAVFAVNHGDAAFADAAFDAAQRGCDMDAVAGRETGLSARVADAAEH